MTTTLDLRTAKIRCDLARKTYTIRLAQVWVIGALCAAYVAWAVLFASPPSSRLEMAVWAASSFFVEWQLFAAVRDVRKARRVYADRHGELNALLEGK